MSPRRRIWLYRPDTDPEVLEIMLLGQLNDIGRPFAAVREAAERWHGFRGVAIIGSGTVCGMLRMELTPLARYVDPIAEALAMLEDLGRRMEWPHRIDWNATSAIASANSGGIVGTW